MEYKFCTDRDEPLKKWSGQYRGVRWSIENFYLYDDCPDQWCYYLWLLQPQFSSDEWNELWLPPQTDGKRVWYDYYASKLSGLPWHGGITWYSKESTPDSMHGAIRAGCDYNHYWDQGHRYNLDMVAIDTRATIDALHELYPSLLWWCFGCGGYGLPGCDGFVDRDGANFEHYSCAHENNNLRKGGA